MPRAIQHGVARIGATMAQQLRRQILKEPQSAWASLRNSTGSEAFRPLRPPQSLAFASITCFGVGSAGYSFLMYLVNFARPVASEQRPQPMCSALISGVPGDDRKGHVTTAMQWTPRAIIAVLRDVDPCPGLPHCARRPLAATGAALSKRPCERCAPPLRALGVSAVYVLFTAETRSTRRDGAPGICFR